MTPTATISRPELTLPEAEALDRLAEGELIHLLHEGVRVAGFAAAGFDLRVDLPAIGPRTVRNAARAGCVGLALEAGGTLVIDREAVARAADRLGLFVWGEAQ